MDFDPILFDLDGTLTDPKVGITTCVQYALHSFGIEEPDPDRLTRFIGPPLAAAFAQFYGFDEERCRRAVEKYRERYGDIGIFENRVYDGILPLLQRLHARGRRLALATSKPTVFARRILEKYELLSYFDVIVGSELDGRRTDKAEIIRCVLAQCPVPDARRAVMVGDRMHDVLGAKKCGVFALGVRYGYAAPGELETAGADAIVDSVDALARFLV